MNITILGNGSGGPFVGRQFTAHFLRLENEVFLLDCGEGTQHQLHRLRLPVDRIWQIFITHLHGDHVFGLIGILSSFSVKKRTAPMEVYGPPGIKKLIEMTAEVCNIHFSYDLLIREIDTEQHALVFESGKLEVWSIPLVHRVPCCGWLFREKPRLRNMRPEKIAEYAIPYTLIPGIKAGEDLLLPNGRSIPNAELTIDPPLPRSYAFCTDSIFTERTGAFVQGVDLLYHEATFTNDNLAEAEPSGHSTAEQAATIARLAGVGRLLIGHFSGRYKEEAQHLVEAQAVFPNSAIAVEGETYEVDLKI